MRLEMMERTMIDALPTTLATPSEQAGELTKVTSRPLPRWLLVVGFWTLIVLAYTTRGEVRTGSYEWVRISWLDAFKAAAAQWSPWGVLSVAIYWVNRKLPVPPDALVRRLLIHVPLSIVFTIVYTYLFRGVTLLLDAPNDPQWVGVTLLETASHVTYRLGTFVYWAIAMVCVALEYQNDLKDREIRTAGLERLLSEARLATLRSQLDPHFLFNTLNSISAYVESAPRQARLMIEQLGDLLRLSLEHADRQEIPLEQELTFIDRYIQLQLVRFADRLDVQVRVDPEVVAAAVPTFLLQPLVENAIRHGTSRLSAAGALDVCAWRSGDRLQVRVRDNGPGLPDGWSLERNSGIGLGNTRARLEHLYGRDEYSLDVTRDDEHGTCVDVTFPYRVA
ncbi:MAG TPA: histidine kinase [Vicinamibacterales bacterium]|nr:histidine kinase [Vicinamibacterales bacterium]